MCGLAHEPLTAVVKSYEHLRRPFTQAADTGIAKHESEHVHHKHTQNPLKPMNVFEPVGRAACADTKTSQRHCKSLRGAFSCSARCWASNNVLTVQDHTGRLKPHTLQSPGMLPVWEHTPQPHTQACRRSALPRAHSKKTAPNCSRQGPSALRYSGLSLHFRIIALACWLAPTHSTPSHALWYVKLGLPIMLWKIQSTSRPCQFSSMTSHCCPSSLGSVWREREWLGL